MAEERKRPESKPKKIYQSPTMSLYGTVRNLTNGGPSGKPEGAGVGNRDKRA